MFFLLVEIYDYQSKTIEIKKCQEDVAENELCNCCNSKDKLANPLDREFLGSNYSFYSSIQVCNAVFSLN